MWEAEEEDLWASEPKRRERVVAPELTEDDLKQAEKKTQELTDKYVKQADKRSAAKQKEVLTL